MRTEIVRLACLLMVSLGCCLQTCGQQQRVSSNDHKNQIQKLLESYTKLEQFSGAVLVAEKGKVVFKGGFGSANRELGVPVSADHRFIIGSMTKAFTAVLVLQAVEAKKLELDQPAKKYWPDFADPTDGKITIRHLLEHRSGLRHWNAIEGFLTKQAANTHDREQLANRFAQTGVRFDPGSQFGYSSPGYYILGIVLSKIWDKDYGDLLAEKIIKPLGMDSTSALSDASIIPGRVASYRYNFVKARYDNAEFRDPTTLFSTGGILSTVDDLLKWDQALYGNKLLSDRSRKIVFNQSNGRQAYGWHNQFPGRDGQSVVWHGGLVTGYRSQITRCLDSKRTVILLGNLRDINTQRISMGIVDILDGDVPAAPRRSLMKAVLKKVANNSVQAALEHFDSIRKSNDGSFDINPTELLRAAIELRSDKEYASAAALYEHWLKTYPNSPYQRMAKQHLADCKRLLEKQK